MNLQKNAEPIIYKKTWLLKKKL